MSLVNHCFIRNFIPKNCNKFYRYAIHPTLHTGICVSLIRNSIRTLVANLGAAGIYTLDDLKNSEIPFDNVQILYIEGFFITHSLNVAQYLIERTKTQKIIITFNLNGEYIFKVIVTSFGISISFNNL